MCCWVVCRPAGSRCCTGPGCPPGRLCCSLGSCSSVSSRPSRSQALESTQERNNPHKAQFSHYCSHEAPVERGLFDCHDIQYRTEQWTFSGPICFLEHLHTRSVRQSPRCCFLSCLDKNALKEEKEKRDSVMSLSSSVWPLWHLFPTTTHSPGSDSRWFCLALGTGPVLGPDNGGTDERGRHTTRQEIGSGRLWQKCWSAGKI